MDFGCRRLLGQQVSALGHQRVEPIHQLLDFFLLAIQRLRDPQPLFGGRSRLLEFDVALLFLHCPAIRLAQRRGKLAAQLRRVIHCSVREPGARVRARLSGLFRRQPGRPPSAIAHRADCFSTSLLMTAAMSLSCATVMSNNDAWPSSARAGPGAVTETLLSPGPVLFWAAAPTPCTTAAAATPTETVHNKTKRVVRVLITPLAMEETRNDRCPVYASCDERSRRGSPSTNQTAEQAFVEDYDDSKTWPATLITSPARLPGIVFVRLCSLIGPHPLHSECGRTGIDVVRPAESGRVAFVENAIQATTDCEQERSSKIGNMTRPASDVNRCSAAPSSI